jgi:SAM-dependent methyltransferase
MSVDYEHSRIQQPLDGPRVVLSLVFEKWKPKSLLDVGCGIGNWGKAAMDLGVPDVAGIDGIAIAKEILMLPEQCFQTHDLTNPWSLGRKFDTVICLEVAEHLDEKHAVTLVKSLAAHGDSILFSAACPGQKGRHHVNCQWPKYWQALFNSEGFSCDDSLRWAIWNDPRVEACYRQNVFYAVKDRENAGREERIMPVLHPEAQQETLSAVENGSMGVKWYFSIPFQGLRAKVRRRQSRNNLLRSKSQS